MKRILVANRGEIACRIIRSIHLLGMEAVAVYSDADEHAMHVQMADKAVRIGPPPAAASYLDQNAIFRAAEQTAADAIHPGYGFLAENASFASNAQKSGLLWIGPDPRSIEDMGDKERARALARGAGVPVLSGSRRFAGGELEGLEEAGQEVGYPLLVKASAGGGGIGMRRVDTPDSLLKVAEATQSMAARSFGDGTIYLERLPKRVMWKFKSSASAAGVPIIYSNVTARHSGGSRKLLKRAPLRGSVARSSTAWRRPRGLLRPLRTIAERAPSNLSSMPTVVISFSWR